MNERLGIMYDSNPDRLEDPLGEHIARETFLQLFEDSKSRGEAGFLPRFTEGGDEGDRLLIDAYGRLEPSDEDKLSREVVALWPYKEDFTGTQLILLKQDVSITSPDTLRVYSVPAPIIYTPQTDFGWKTIQEVLKYIVTEQDDKSWNIEEVNFAKGAQDMHGEWEYLDTCGDNYFDDNEYKYWG